VRVAAQLQPQHATFFTVGLSGPRYDVAKLTDWVAFRDDHDKHL
jgi:hypothetical protein